MSELDELATIDPWADSTTGAAGGRVTIEKFETV
jgi:hypothetical protein